MRKFVFTILTIFATSGVFAQTSVSFYHLGRATYQNSQLNPAWIPEGKLFVGLPVLSGVHVHVNNKLSYNELFTKENNQILLDVDKVLSNLQRQNMVSAQVNVNLLHIGYTFDAGPTLSFFANERVEVDALYPREIVDFVWNGNNTLLNEKVQIGRVGARASHFREIGIGFAAPVTDQLDFGLRAKYMIGFLDASTPGNLTANLTTSGEFFQLEGELKNAQFRTSGVDIYDETVGDLGSHLVSNSNTGLAVDIGAEYKLSRYYSIAGSILDIGWINWKENVVNETLNDTTFTYRGVNLDGVGDIRDALEDSLFSRFETTETNDAYKSWLPVRAYGSWIYHYSPQTDFYATVGTRLIHGQLKMLYGGGITHEFGKAFTASISGTKLPQQFFNIGAAFAVNGGPIQLYMAADQVINFSVPDAKAFDFRFGMNIKIRRRQEELAEDAAVGKAPIAGAKGIDTNVFLGKSVKTKKRDGIYSVIKKQKRRKVEKQVPRKNKKKVSRKSLTGRRFND